MKESFEELKTELENQKQINAKLVYEVKKLKKHAIDLVGYFTLNFWCSCVTISYSFFYILS